MELAPAELDTDESLLLDAGMLELPDPREEDPPAEDAPAEEDAGRDEDPGADDASMETPEDAADVPALEDERPALLDAVPWPASPGAGEAEQ